MIVKKMPLCLAMLSASLVLADPVTDVSSADPMASTPADAAVLGDAPVVAPQPLAQCETTVAPEASDVAPVTENPETNLA